MLEEGIANKEKMLVLSWKSALLDDKEADVLMPVFLI